MIKLGVNIDHVATLREARGGIEPIPSEAALIAQNAGADGLTIHLREDRRHIKESDVYAIKNIIQIPLNLEMACDDGIIMIAKDVLPHMCTIVPEKRQELTTEGGLDVISMFSKVSDVVQSLQSSGILVSLFIEPDIKQIEKTAEAGAEYIEIHTGRYSEDYMKTGRVNAELERIKKATSFAQSIGLKVNAGHGLNYSNISPIVDIKELEELNIGHSIISKAVFIGLGAAVKEMKRLICG